MMRCKLLFFIISLATLQASQISDQELNNTNKKSDTLSTYTHGEQQDWQALIKDVEYEDLKKHLIKLYQGGIARPTAHITTTPPVYFVGGPTGSGKSTFIFVLQGNQIEKKQSKRGRRKKNNQSNNVPLVQNTSESNTTYSNTGALKLTKTIKLPTPEVATGNHGVTKGVKIYYTGEKAYENIKIKKPIAFCDTEGFLGQRKENTSKAEAITATYAPYFVLKGNPIGGIILLIDAGNITTDRGKNFFTSMKFLKSYFDLGMVGENKKVLAESIMVLINKVEGQEDDVYRKLAELIRDSYRYCYERSMEENKNNKCESNQSANTVEECLIQLNPFFSLFLKGNVPEDEIKNKITEYVKNLKKLDEIKDRKKIKKCEEKITDFFDNLINDEKIRCFYPDDKEEVQKIRKALDKLVPLDPKYLSLYDNKICQYLIKQITCRAHSISQQIDSAFRYKNIVQLQQLFLQRNNKNKLQTLPNKLKKRKQKLDEIQKTLSDKKMLQVVFENRHVEDTSVEKRKKGLTELFNNVKNVIRTGTTTGGKIGGKIGLGLTAVAVGIPGLVLGGVGAGIGGILGRISGNTEKGIDTGATIGAGILLAPVGSVLSGALGLTGGILGGIGGMLGGFGVGIKGFMNYGYLLSDPPFEYVDGDPIYQIIMEEKNNGTIIWENPKEKFIKENFNREVDKKNKDITIFTSKSENGTKHNAWRFYHSSAYQEHAQLSCIKLLTKKHCLQASKWQKEYYDKKVKYINELLEKIKSFENMDKDKPTKEIYSNKTEELIKLQEEMNLISCWSNRIFRKAGPNQELVHLYITDYNEIVPKEHKVSKRNNDMISLYQDNKKHSNNQPGLKNKIEDEEETKEDDNDHQSKSSTSLTITAILASLLSQQD